MTKRLQVCIVERDMFVSEDMLHSLHSVLPSADCSVFTNVAEARSSVEQGGNPQLVLISSNADGTFFASQDDAKWLVNRKVIVFDAHNRVPHPEWVHLTKPFTEEELMDAVKALVSSGAGEQVARETG